MTIHLAAFAESIAPNDALINIAAVQDDTVFTSGDDIRVPGDLPFIMGVAGLNDTDGEVQMQVQSPSLRRVTNINVIPFGLGQVFGVVPEYDLFPENPIPVDADEAINFLSENSDAVGALNYGLVWFSDGPQTLVNGASFPIRAVMSVTGVATSWINGALTFSTDLPVGNYDVVGMRAQAAGLVAARLNFVGGSWRPGCVGQVLDTAQNIMQLRHGRTGIWGTFHTNTPPTVDILAAAAAITPEIFLDIIPRG